MRTLHRDAISLSVTALAAAMTATSALADVRIQVDVTTVRSIDGHSELDRNKFFAVCDSGSIAQRAPDDQTLDFLLDDLDVRFGRQLGPVRWGLGGRASYQEDPSRPGFVDADNVREVARPTPYTESFKAKAGRLNVVSHGAHAGFPDFMGERQTDVTAEQDPKNHLPDNIEAAAELSALIFKYGYSDFDRPIWYEPINEPHWTHFREQHLADWHVATVAAFEAAALDTLVGGPCLSVAYFYKNGFNGFNGLKQFIDDTDGRLPFYSFHAYDYFTWEDGELGGRVTSGLPLHGSLDIVAAYGHHEYGRVFPIVLSEHGGYVNRGADAFRDDVIGPRQDVTTEAGWEHEMRRRSLDAFQLVSSVIANTLVFMDHPHTVEKAVPFILPESMAWDPEYYSVMWVPKH
ncbi:MAG: beta-agarase, partial [Planctomycetota bacterium]